MSTRPAASAATAGSLPSTGAVRGSADDLLCLAAEDRVTARADRVGTTEHRPCIVAGGVGLRRRGAELDRRVGQTIEKIFCREPDLRHRNTAQCIAREHRDPDCAAVLQQFERVPHICRSEQVDVLTLLDALAQQTRRTKLGGDRRAGCLFIVLLDLAHDLSETSRGEDVQLFGCPRIGDRQHVKRHQQQQAQDHATIRRRLEDERTG